MFTPECCVFCLCFLHLVQNALPLQYFEGDNTLFTARQMQMCRYQIAWYISTLRFGEAHFSKVMHALLFMSSGVICSPFKCQIALQRNAQESGTWSCAILIWPSPKCNSSTYDLFLKEIRKKEENISPSLRPLSHGAVCGCDPLAQQVICPLIPDEQVDNRFVSAPLMQSKHRLLLYKWADVNTLLVRLHPTVIQSAGWRGNISNLSLFGG